MTKDIENLDPTVYTKSAPRESNENDWNDDVEDEIDAREVFDLIRTIKDPEHPLTLEELHVIEQDLIEVDDKNSSLRVLYTPTIPHCSMASLIGLSIRVKLLLGLPPRFKISVEINPGTHSAEKSINKQIADKERVAAALENENLRNVIFQCIMDKNW